jgi:hypothetical protein
MNANRRRGDLLSIDRADLPPGQMIVYEAAVHV